MKKSKVSNPVFEALPAQTMKTAIGGSDWCDSPTEGGTHRSGQTYSKDVVHRDGNGLYLNTTYYFTVQ